MNLFYSLPEDILCIIYRNLYNRVIHELNHRPGNFKFIEDLDYSILCDSPFYLEQSVLHYSQDFISVLDKYYRAIEQIGPHAWEYLKYWWNLNYIDPISSEIELAIDHLPVIHTWLFPDYLEHLIHIAKHGWDHYKKYFEWI